MRLTDEDLRHGPLPAAGHHLRPGRGCRVDVDLLQLDTLFLEQLPRTHAVRTPARGVHDGLRAGHPLAFAPFSSGRLSARHAATPPRRLKACSNPWAFSCRAADPPTEPDSSSRM